MRKDGRRIAVDRLESLGMRANDAWARLAASTQRIGQWMGVYAHVACRISRTRVRSPQGELHARGSAGE